LKSLSDDLTLPSDTSNIVFVTNSERFPLAARVFHPGVMRVFKSNRASQISNPILNDAEQLAEKVLRSMNRQLTKMSMERLRVACNIPAHMEFAGFIDSHFSKLVNNSDERQLKSLVSILMINQSRSIRLWPEFDEIICSKSSIVDIDTQLLIAYGILSSKSQFSIKFQPRYPEKLLKSISDEKISLSSLPFTEDSEIFDSLNSMVVRENLAVERLSLLLYLFAAQPKSLSQIRQSNPKLLEDLSKYSSNVLTAIQNPVKLATLKHVWENLAVLNLPDSNNLYRKLHQQVSFSIAIDDLQVNQHEECVPSLLSCMVTSKNANGALIEKIHEIVESRGFSYDQYGMQMFNALIQLKSFPFAISILESVLENSNFKIDFLFKQWKKDRKLLSSDAKDYINTWLLKEHAHNASTEIDQNGNIIPSFDQSIKHRRTSFDLIFGLFSFGRDYPSSEYGQTLKKVEASILSKLPLMNIHELVSVIHSYGLVGRYHPDMIQVFDDLIGKSIQVLNERIQSETDTKTQTDGNSKLETGKERVSSIAYYKPAGIRELSLFQIQVILWSFARLNHRSVHLKELKKYYLDSFQRLSTFYRTGAADLARVLWSLAVVEELDYEAFSIMREYLLNNHVYRKGADGRAMMMNQITQIRNEFECQARQLQLDLPRLKNQNYSAKQSQALIDAKDKLEKLRAAVNDISSFCKQHNYVATAHHSKAVISSSTHIDGSKTLSKLGIAHENEKMLPNGYLVDVFISKYRRNAAEVLEDIVLEFDGPSHFDSYLQNPLGPKLMKTRHLLQLGYKVVTIKNYFISATPEEKGRVIRTALDNLD
jgi:hypothetical protein